MTGPERTRRAGAASSWIAGAVLGALGGLLVLIFPILGAILMAAAVVVVVRTGRMLPGLGGLLIGIRRSRG